MLTYFPPPISAARWSNSGLLGLRGFWDDTAGVVDQLTAKYATTPATATGTVEQALPKNKPVPLSTDMSYQQRIDYALGGYYALQPYIEAAPLLFDDHITAGLEGAQESYARAYDVIRQNLGTFTNDQFILLQAADNAASSALAAFKASPVPPSSAAAVAKVARTIPTGAINAASLHAAQAGFFDSLSAPAKVGLVVALIWGGKKLLGL